MMIEFILNDRLIQTGKPQGMPLADFIRYESGLRGTKIGCREGDCGACTVMEGKNIHGNVVYKTILSCLTPLGKVHGRHIVTVEGLNGETLNPAQQAIADHSGTQCGFCTPGFVVSLMTHCLSGDTSSLEKTLASLDGNICRCTGYKSLERAARQVWELNQSRNNAKPVEWMVGNRYLPAWFIDISKRLSAIEKAPVIASEDAVIIGGGTDLMVSKADELMLAGFSHPIPEVFNEIEVTSGWCRIGGSVTMSEMLHSATLKPYFPRLEEYFKRISSTPVRNMATVAGNLANASPIADLAIFFLALDANILLTDVRQGNKRLLPLKEFFTGYKKLNLRKGEVISEVQFNLPDKESRFNFEKVSRREHLDIASVNSAILVSGEEGRITSVCLSAGGVSPIPLYLGNTCEFLAGKQICAETLTEACGIIQSEIAPISDIRGSEAYKRLLLRQLFLAHFIELFPDNIDIPMLISTITAGEKH
ncbi:MAG TPA: FAD binding domain-containing protein [Bacteroidales bacterium]|nr:FAD binding domain-containing protein [Bacteroidales bacterium]HPT01740.1 FAD binding domain-containing protein [Bacteroidales bacterium]